MPTSINDDMSRLEALGFEEGELEMFFDMNPNISANQLIQKYMEVASDYFHDVTEAMNAPYQIPASNLTKHDIAKQTLYYIEHHSEQPVNATSAAAAAGGKRVAGKGKRKGRRTRRRNSRKHRKLRKHGKHTNKYRRL